MLHFQWLAEQEITLLFNFSNWFFFFKSPHKFPKTQQKSLVFITYLGGAFLWFDIPALDQTSYILYKSEVSKVLKLQL